VGSAALVGQHRHGGCPSGCVGVEPVKGWGGVVGGVAVLLAIVFVSLFDFGSLLGDHETGATDSPAVSTDSPADTTDGQRVYWEDLQPGMCTREDPNDMDYIVVDCSAEHEEEVMSRGTLAGSKKWPGDAALEDTAGEKWGQEVKVKPGVIYLQSDMVTSCRGTSERPGPDRRRTSRGHGRLTTAQFLAWARHMA
jgi:hypothetical protein